jgi:hypothetical protein
MRRPLQAGEALGLAPLESAARALAARVKRVPDVAAVAHPGIVLSRNPTALWTANASAATRLLFLDPVFDLEIEAGAAFFGAINGRVDGGFQHGEIRHLRRGASLRGYRLTVRSGESLSVY